MGRWLLGLGHLAWKGIRDFAVQIVVSIITTVCMSIAGSSLLWKGESAPQPVTARQVSVTAGVTTARLAAFGHPLFLTSQNSPYRAEFARPATVQWAEEPVMISLAALPCRTGCAPQREDAQPAPSRAAAEAAIETAASHLQADPARDGFSWLPRLEAIGRSAGTLAGRMAAAVPRPF